MQRSFCRVKEQAHDLMWVGEAILVPAWPAWTAWTLNSKRRDVTSDDETRHAPDIHARRIA